MRRRGGASPRRFDPPRGGRREREGGGGGEGEELVRRREGGESMPAEGCMGEVLFAGSKCTYPPHHNTALNGWSSACRDESGSTCLEQTLQRVFQRTSGGTDMSLGLTGRR